MAEWKGIPYGRTNEREAWFNERKRAKSVAERLRVSRVWATGPVEAEYNQVCCIDPTLGAITVTLPPATALTGHAVWVKNVTSSTTAITVWPRGLDLIDGQTSDTMTGSYLATQYISTGDGWLRI